MKKIISMACIALTFCTNCCMAQVEKNTLTVDGNLYEFDTDIENAITLKKDRYDNWNLMAFVKIDGKNIAFNIATSQEKMADGTYSLMYRLKRVEQRNVAFSVNIINEKDGVMAALNMKQFTSTENGKAEIKNEKGVYSITLNNVEAINMKQIKFTLSGNITLDPNELKTRKERSKENEALNMREAFLNEYAYTKMQDDKFFKTYNRNATNLSKEIVTKLNKNKENIISSFKELLKILNRKNDESIPLDIVNKQKEIISFKLNEYKQEKAEQLHKLIQKYFGEKMLF
jgi:hypothetical protein